jgi:very-short-patch-repair endonuclease
MSGTREVIDQAKRNGGVVTVQEAIALGLPRSTISRRVDDGIFVRIGRGVLALPGASTRSDLALRAAARSLGAIVSHESAALVHGFEPIRVEKPSVTVTHRGTHGLPGVRVHQSTDLLPDHVTTVGELRTTIPTRTVIDLAKVLGRRRLERVVDNALAAGIVGIDDLATLFTAIRRPGKPGVRNLAAILEPRLGDELAASETELEAILFNALVDAGLPPPEKQFRAPWLKPVRGRVDLAYGVPQIVIEADSRRWHTLFDAFEADRRRDNAAMLAGWVVLRYTWRMISEEPWTIVKEVREALETR